MNFLVFSKNGKILPIAEAQVPLLSIEYAYGFGVYETIRVKNDKPLFLSDHLERLELSAKIIKLEHPFVKKEMEKFVLDFVEKVKAGTFNLKILLIGAEKKENATLYIMGSNPLFVDKKSYQNGVKTITTEYERVYPQAKTLNMLASYLAYREAKEKNCYDALLLNKDGNITEGTRTNFFTIKGQTIYSPLEKNNLLGVTRKHILEVAKQNGFRIKEKNIPLTSLSEYDGAFLTGTSIKILPIKKVDDYEYGEIPDGLKKLMLAFDEYLNTVS
ncbi:MAG: aminotransferase class IV [Patescibacteria group bacterium]